MPGKSLTQLEKDLLARWNNRGMPDGCLLALKVEGDPGLRGLKALNVEFRYPVTVVSGRNGSGKTTLLALSALAFNGCDGFFPKNAKKKSTRSYYTFKHFFYRGPSDADLTGIRIEWKIKHKDGDKVIRLKKQTSKWMKYERRPDRAVYYLGTSRLISATELNVLKSHFKHGKKVDEKYLLDEKYINYLNYILSSTFEEACELRHKDYYIRTCRTATSSYSSFNMGAGEDAIIEILVCIQKLPEKSLCVIEEIELGIHPEALRRLANVLQDIAKNKKIQFVISSHSADFIDSLPRVARVLLDKNGNDISVLYSPTTRYAMGKMGSAGVTELCVFCEDELAKNIIESALTNSVRQRVSIIPIGGKTELVRAYMNNKKASCGRFKGLVVWDGDVSDALIDSEMQKYSDGENIPYTKLPGEGCPEQVILRTLLAKGVEKLTRVLRIDSQEETKALLEGLLSLQDVHAYVYEASKKLNMGLNKVRNYFMQTAIDVSLDEYKTLSDKVKSILENE